LKKFCRTSRACLPNIGLFAQLTWFTKRQNKALCGAIFMLGAILILGTKYKKRWALAGFVPVGANFVTQIIAQKTAAVIRTEKCFSPMSTADSLCGDTVYFPIFA